MKADKWLVQLNVANDVRLESAERQDAVIGHPGFRRGLNEQQQKRAPEGRGGPAGAAPVTSPPKRCEENCAGYFRDHL